MQDDSGCIMTTARTEPFSERRLLIFRPRLLVLCVLLAAALPVAIGCGEGGSKGPHATSSADHYGLPESLLYPGAQAVGDMDWSVDDITTSLNVLETTDSVPAVIAHYTALMAGWKDHPAKTQSGGTSIGRTSPDGKQTVVITAKRGSDGKTTVSIYRIESDTTAKKP
jgi:hypothetical protein